MYKLKLEAIGVREEKRIVPRGVMRILGGRVQHLGADVAKDLMEAIDISAACRAKSDVMQTGDIAVVVALMLGRLESD